MMKVILGFTGIFKNFLGAKSLNNEKIVLNHMMEVKNIMAHKLGGFGGVLLFLLALAWAWAVMPKETIVDTTVSFVANSTHNTAAVVQTARQKEIIQQWSGWGELMTEEQYSKKIAEGWIDPISEEYFNQKMAEVLTFNVGATTSTLPEGFVIPAASMDSMLAATAAAGTLGGVQIPEEWYENDWKHAAESRGSMLRVLLAWELIRLSATELYCGVTPYGRVVQENRCLIVAYDPVIGPVGMVITNAGEPSAPKWGRPVTIIFSTSGMNVRAARISGCLSWKILTLPVEYQTEFDPPSVGIGKCLINH